MKWRYEFVGASKFTEALQENLIQRGADKDTWMFALSAANKDLKLEIARVV
jgi:hypothetical protein